MKYFGDVVLRLITYCVWGQLLPFALSPELRHWFAHELCF